jgi:FixJ family two-component response regulator
MFKAYDFAIAIRRNLAAFTNKSPYKKPRRKIAKREIRRLIIDEGLTNRQISERINIPQRTVERYISELYKFDNQLLAGMNDNSIEEALTAWSICKERIWLITDKKS